jgi:hypothetical protein
LRQAKQETKNAPENMKKLLTSTIFSAFALMALHTTASQLPATHGPVSIQWTISQQKLDGEAKYAGNGKTSISGVGDHKTTNVLQIYSFTSTAVPFGNSSLLALLENSLNTTFPDGTKLVWTGTYLAVVDENGTNVIDQAEVDSVISVTTTNEILDGLRVTAESFKASGKTGTSTQSGAATQVLIVNYNDTGLTTTDGTTSNFKFIGLSAYTYSAFAKLSKDVITTSGSDSFTVHGVGYGLIRNINSTITGTIVGSASGTESEADD